MISRLYQHNVTRSQVSIQQLIKPEKFDFLDIEFKQHNCDIVSIVEHANGGPKETLVIEVNYKHREKAAWKWRRTFNPDLIDNDKTPITIDDYDCREKGLFHLNSKREHVVSWDDYRDVIDQLEKAGVEP